MNLLDAIRVSKEAVYPLVTMNYVEEVQDFPGPSYFTATEYRAKVEAYATRRVQDSPTRTAEEEAELVLSIKQGLVRNLHAHLYADCTSVAHELLHAIGNYEYGIARMLAVDLLDITSGRK